MLDQNKSGNLITVLIVEDDELMRVFYERLFRRHQDEFVVRLKTNAQDALEFLRENNVHAAILDWDLPGINGLQLLKAIRANPGTKGLPVVIASGRSAQDFAALALRHRATVYLAKPFEAEVLLAHLRGFAS